MSCVLPSPAADINSIASTFPAENKGDDNKTEDEVPTCAVASRAGRSLRGGGPCELSSAAGTAPTAVEPPDASSGPCLVVDRLGSVLS